ncbi:hypothetical protein G7Y89_g12321 [Cudoniella acicularis]|uniref:Major facilitator superfamily (MFS) profile domain-containing protein n=1 Tax=Cudoniella acicularis TaxID=354080 RepID=A0A8H4R9D7_9HELO|nr:hypothetical protein G7Y89_g12321 [Cudoniella acicularis]
MSDREKSQVEEFDHAIMQRTITQQTGQDPSGLEKARTGGTIDTVAASAIGGDYHDLPAGYYRSPKFIGTFVGVVFMAWSLYVGYVLPSATLAIINEDIGPSPNYVLIVTVTTVTSGCLLTIVGRMGDILGRRYFLIGGQCFGLIGGIIGATAKTVNTLIGGSVFMGIGGAVQLTFTFVICELVPNKHRAYVDSALFFCIIPFAALGPILARLLATQTAAGWRWFYYLNIICCGASIILFTLFYFPPNYQQLHTRTSKREQFKKIDYVGMVLFTAGVILFMLGLSWGGSSYPWKSGPVLGCIISGVVSLIIFVFYEIYAPLSQPLLPMKLLKNRNYVAISCSACVGTIIYFSMNVLWPEQVAGLYATDNITIGWLSCTTGIGVIVGQVLAGLVFKPLGGAKWQLLACCVGMTVFLGGLAAANQNNKGLAIAFTILGGISVGFLELITIIMAGLVCEPGDIGLASGFLASLRQVFGTIATTIYVTILTNRLKTTIPENVIPAAENAGLPTSSLDSLFAALTAGTAAALQKVPGITTDIIAAVGEAVKTADSQAFKTVYLTSIAFGGLSIIAALCASNVDEKLTDQVARRFRGTNNVDEVAIKGKADEEN